MLRAGAGAAGGWRRLVLINRTIDRSAELGDVLATWLRAQRQRIEQANSQVAGKSLGVVVALATLLNLVLLITSLSAIGFVVAMSAVTIAVAMATMVRLISQS